MSSDVLSYLASVAARSLVLFAVAAGALFVLRVKSAAARHAVWTVVMAGMLALAALTPLLPPAPLRVLKAAATATAFELPAVPVAVTASSGAAPATAASWRPTWADAAIAGYGIVAAILLARLLFGYLFTRRLLRAATPIPGRENLYSSAWISVPLTVGRKVLLPADWATWSKSKLDAVLAHERTHVRRADWTIALLAGINRAIFWFHPLAWWLERRLATLAEQACDDSALLLVETEPYAQALLDMAAAVRTTQGRLVWEAMAMAKAAEVRTRIERILDETREIPRALTRAGWAALLACSVPLIWLVSAAQLAPAVAQETPKTPAAMAEYLKGRQQLSPADVAAMEQYLVTTPHDVAVRSQLILHYYATGVRQPRIDHIVWLVENHPDTPQAIFASQGVLPRDNALNSYPEYQRVAAAWRRAVATHQGYNQVVSNAARFLERSGEVEAAEKLLLDAEALGRNRGFGPATDQLARLYAAAILGATGDPKFPNPSPSFAARVRRDLEASENGMLLQLVALSLRGVAQRPQAGQPLPANVMNLDDHPLLLSAMDFADRLTARAQQLGGPRVVTMSPRMVATGGQGGVPGGVLGGIVGSVPAGATMPPPANIRKVDPEYPPLARQARISGVVVLRATVATDGQLKRVGVVSGHPLLVEAAMESIRKWTFPPIPVESTWTFDIPFGGVSGGVQGGVPGGVIGGIVGSVTAGASMPPPPNIRKVDPEYPPLARQARISGVVLLRATVATDGQLKRMEVVSGHPLLVQAAMEAVRKWTFPPIPSETTWTFDIPFNLPQDAAQATQSPRPAVPSRIKIGGNILASKLIRKVDPVYPPQARAEGIQGEVTLQVLVDKSGQVIQADPVEGNPVLAAPARDAVLQWAYSVTLLNGEPVEVSSTVVVPFRNQ